MKIILGLLISTFLAVPAFAAFNLQNISDAELESLNEEFGAVTLHTAIAPAGSLGKLFGFQVGILAGMTSTPTVERISKENNEDISGIPSAAIVAQVSVPLGLTVEGSFVPSLDTGDAEYSNMGLGVRWTMTETLVDLPVDLAFRVAMNQSELSFLQTVSAVEVKTTYESTATTASLIIGKDLVIVEPYVGVGYISTDGKLSVAGSNPIFDSGNLSETTDSSGMYYFGGLELNILLQLGVEVMKVYDSTRYSAKIAFGF